MYQISCWFNPGAVGWVPSSVYGLLVNWAGATLFDSTNFLDTWTNIQLQASATSTSTVLEFGYWADEVTSLADIDVFPISPALGIAGDLQRLHTAKRHQSDRHLGAGVGSGEQPDHRNTAGDATVLPVGAALTLKSLPHKTRFE
jgi:hypothetical protein